ncbi:MAG: hypothetical protein ACSHYB_11600 [Roseibacillus sp.]
MRSLLIFLFLINANCIAQSSRSIEVRTLCFDYAHRVREVTLSGDDIGESQATSKLLKYLDTKQSTLIIAENTVRVGETAGESGLKVWSRVPVPPSIKEALFVFFPSNNPEKPYLIKVFDDSEKAFPLASFQIANMSHCPLRFIIGGQPLEIQPGKNTFLSEFKQKKANGQVPYYAYSQKDQDWKRLSTGFWDVIPRKRTFQIAFSNPTSNKVELRGYDDSLPIMKALLKAQQK